MNYKTDPVCYILSYLIELLQHLLLFQDVGNFLGCLNLELFHWWLYIYSSYFPWIIKNNRTWRLSSISFGF